VNTPTSEVGRPGINLELNPDAGYLIGLEIGVGFISLIVTDFTTRIVARRYESTLDMEGPAAILERTLDLLRDAFRQYRQPDRPIFGIGVGVPGLVDTTSGLLLFAPNLGWENVALQEIIAREFPVPVRVANEANMAAFGESYFGDEQESRFLLYVSTGVGLGGGIVVDGQLLSGATGFAGEFGHMTVVPDGLPCNCGNVGCWETVATQQAVFRFVQAAAKAGRKTALTGIVSGDWRRLTIPAVVGAAQQGDAVAREALKETGHWLGIGIANLVNVINPRHVILGGPLSQAHAFLLPVIRETAERHALKWAMSGVTIGVAAHAADGAAMGGIAAIHSMVLNDLQPWL
jgi:glucokinase-like ROK family protein